jgi:dTDP-4-amino-4,6-dideoxy-D-galactose acyltransferase
MDVQARLTRDTWLSETLGRAVFRMESPASIGQADMLAVEMARLSNGGDAFIYAKLPTADIPACIALTNAGFAIVDTNITLSWADGDLGANDKVTVGIAKREQFDAIPKIAERCFRWSRFHLDPKIPSSVANLIKRRWIENYVVGKRGSALYAAEIDGAVAGFLAVLESKIQNRAVAVIDLVGVAPEFQGRGVGAALVRTFVRDWINRVTELRVGTQAANVQSLRFYERCGFRIVESSYVLHAHYNHGKIDR